jgi:dihydroxy-acid dehydratase
VIHLLALAGRVGVPLSLHRFDEIARTTPRIANLRPSGERLIEDLHRAGGVPALLRELDSLLHRDALTITGASLASGYQAAENHDPTVIASLATPFSEESGLAVLRGSLAPNGAVIKRAAASPALYRHRGPALVFEDVHDVAARIDDPALDVGADSVLVLRNSGPQGGPGMPEWGAMPIPARLLKQGVTDMLRVSDARMSGTAFGTVVLHVSPESFIGGPLAAVRDGDPIVLDIEERKIDLDIPRAEIERRLSDLGTPPPRYRRGYGSMYLQHVLQADEGCDFDYLRARPGEPAESEPYGLLTGWVGGW